ncbi:MAG: cysteine-rich CWC family protein [Acidobacteria bacterium]|nr:cysteine-rich CWC family protein [Acidobacteriota bacterium]
MNAAKTDKLTCESCGKEFSCGAKIGKCWCFEVDLKTETSAQLRENFKNCLCQNCLENLAANYTNKMNKIIS